MNGLSLPDFVAIVQDMRHNQKEYFPTRSDSAIQAAKAAEKRVDAALREYASKQA